MTNVLLVAAEAAPFVKTGGLGEVVGSLSRELNGKDMDVRVMMPKHKNIPCEFVEQMEKICDITINVGWRQQVCTVEKLKYEGISFYFIGNEYYFGREALYGFGDDGERYAFFCQAVLAAIPHLEFVPDVLHCHDWHTGMISVFLDANYANDPEYQKIKTLFTVHNLKYQGVFPKEIMSDILNLGWEYFNDDGVECEGCVNFMKGGLAFSDMLTTVSAEYAVEIQTPDFGEQMDRLLIKRSAQLTGIINGIDYTRYNPSGDPHIFVPYNARSLKKRQENKLHLQQMLGLTVSNDMPLIGVMSRLTPEKDFALVAAAVEQIASIDMQLAVVGTGEHKYQDLLRSAARRYPDKIAVSSGCDEMLMRRIYAGSDMMLIPSQYEPCGKSQLVAMRYGSVPIVRAIGGLKDTVSAYNKKTHEGNGFQFDGYNTDEMMQTLAQAVELFKNKKVWNQIIRNAMKGDYSWRQSANQYQVLYKKLVEK